MAVWLKIISCDNIRGGYRLSTIVITVQSVASAGRTNTLHFFFFIVASITLMRLI